MKSKKPYSITVNQYQNLDTNKISTILLKDGTMLQINNNFSSNSYGNKSFNRNISDSSLPVNNDFNLTKVRKFNSFSSNMKYKAQFNNKNLNNGFYVTPIINASRKYVAIKVSDIPQNIDFNTDNRHVENISFKVSPKKYAYKPYKPPKRKHNLILTNTTNNYNFYVSNNKKQ